MCGGEILMAVVGSGWNRVNPTTQYDQRITASTFLPFSCLIRPVRFQLGA
jgi:hypothetical protein